MEKNIDGISPHFAETLALVERGEGTSKIQSFLQDKGIEEEERNEIIAAAKKHYYGRRRHRGTILALIGSVFLVLGFFVMMALGGGNGFNYIMYGMTSVGAILLLAGMVDVLGF